MKVQLMDIIITISFVDYDDEGNPFTTSKVFRGDLECAPENIDHVVNEISDREDILEMSKMTNE